MLSNTTLSSPLVLAFLLLCTACTTDAAPPTAAAAYYHWQTVLAPDSTAYAKLAAAGAERLYVKFFDVDWDADTRQPIPKAVLDARAWPQGVAIVPTVFITNRTMAALTPAQADTLAGRVWARIQTLLPDGYDGASNALGAAPGAGAGGRVLRSHLPAVGTAAPPSPARSAAPPSLTHRAGHGRIPEVQIDCDWTASTRAVYFHFLTTLRARLPQDVALSATLRLHQYRYPHRTGIPPADRAMLMFYNMGQLDDPDEPNSILNLAAAQPYLDGAPAYPMPLDVALPLFRWGILYRDGHMTKLIHDLTATELAADTARFVHVAPGTRRQPSAPPGQGGSTRGRSEVTNGAPGRQRSEAGSHVHSPTYEVRKNTYLHGYYLYPGDRIRTEAVTPALLRDARRTVDALPTCGDVRYVAYYHLGSDFWID